MSSTNSGRRAFNNLCAALCMAIAGQVYAQVPAEWAQVIQQAKQEGSVTFYNGGLPTVPRVVIKMFEAQYGIKVNVLEARMSEVRERVRAEQAASRWLVDVVLAGASTIAQQQREGALVAHGPLPAAASIVSPYKSRADGTLVPLNANKQALLINTKLVKPEDEPKTWADLLDPKWKGKILSDDPRAAGGGNLAYWVLYDAFGPAFHQKLAAQQLVFSRELSMNPKRVAAGEYPLLLPIGISEAVKLKGLPVKVIVPKEGMTYGMEALGIAKNAPHPNAARLLINFMLEGPSQAVFADYGFGSATNQPPKVAPELPKEVLDAPLLGTTQADPAKSDMLYKFFSDTYK
jgi:iron(III) transport system substrate-binding protein